MRLLGLCTLGVAFTVIMVGGGCGGNSETPTTATQTISPTLTPVSTASATAPRLVPTAAGVTGSVLDKPIFPSFELDGIRYGGTVRSPTTGSSALDPKLNNSAIGTDIRPVYEKLVKFEAAGDDPFMQLAPGLAESWSSSTDLMTYTFKLRRGVRWQNVPPVNGREFVAADAAFSMNRYREKDAVAYSLYQQIESIETPDNYTVVVKVKEPTAYLIQDLFANFDYVVSPELVAESGGTLTTKAVGTGPYIMKRFALRQGSSHVRNPDYWGKDSKGNPLPYTDAWEVPYIPDTTTQNAAFRAGQLDFTDATNLDTVIAMGKTTPMRVYSTGVDLQGQGFTFRSDKAPWNDVRVRRAFNHAIDKNRFGDIVAGPGRWLYSGPLPFGLFFGRALTLDDLGPYAKYDPAATKRLLIEAGFKDGTMTVPTTLAAAQTAVYGPRTSAFQALYKEQGIYFELQSMDMATYNPYYFNRAFADIALTHHISIQPNLNSYAQAKWHPDAAQNTAWINNPEVNRVLKEIKMTTDPVKIRDYAKFLWDFDTLGSYTVWTPVNIRYTVGSARIRNFSSRTGGTGFVPLLWLADAPRTSP